MFCTSTTGVSARKRTEVLHYEFALNVEQIKGVIARALNIFNHLYTKHLNRGGGLGSEISVRLLEFRKAVDERMRRLEPRLKKSKRPWVRECPDCSQPALIIGQSGEPTCIFCGADTTAKRLARRCESDEFNEIAVRRTKFGPSAVVDVR